MGTARHEIHCVSLGFSRVDESAPDTARAAVLYGYNVPISGQADSREVRPLQRKENSSRDSRRRLRVRLRCRTGPTCCQGGPISVLGFGNINPIPFR